MILVRNDIGWVGPFEACPKDEILFNFLALGCNPKTTSTAQLAGAILTETIFSWPGIGKWMVDSIFRRDYPSVQGGLLMIAGIVMMVNLIVDVLYGLINPRIRHVV